ncbi:hypothetical protein ACFE04_005521 [Oxalis oulophora]
MEASMWKLEDKMNISTKDSVVVLIICIALVAIIVCIVIILKKKSQSTKPVTADESKKCSGSGATWYRVRDFGSVRWSKAKKWKAGDRGYYGGWDGLRQSPLLGLAGVGWQSHNSESPVWQRPILMGEKCELPKFSGVILYDENGRPLDQSPMKQTSSLEITHQGKAEAVLRTTLRDLM